MAIKRRIFVSMPADSNLTPAENQLKWEIVKLVEKTPPGFEVQYFTGPTGGRGLPAGRSWGIETLEKVMRRCVGAVVIGLPRWRIPADPDELLLATEMSHHEGAVATSVGLPTLVIATKNLAERGIFDRGAGLEITLVPPDADASWLAGEQFKGYFQNWKNRIDHRRDVFLGYSSGARGVAKNVRQFLANLGVTCLDWHEDFAPAGSILEQIQEAAERCSGGVFLFTKDDQLEGDVGQAAPRDNVVFEAGYFAAAKGKPRVLIIREKGAKMPADLGGDIYAGLADKSDIGPIEPVLRNFVEQRL